MWGSGRSPLPRVMLALALMDHLLRHRAQNPPCGDDDTTSEITLSSFYQNERPSKDGLSRLPVSPTAATHFAAANKAALTERTRDRMMRSWMVGLWGVGLLLTTAAHAESQRDLRVIGVIDEPNRWLDGADRPVGIDVDILAELMQRLGLHYQLVLTSSALRALDSCQQPHPSVDMYLTLSSIVPSGDGCFIQANPTSRFAGISLPCRRRCRACISTAMRILKARIGVTKGFAYTGVLECRGAGSAAHR